MRPFVKWAGGKKQLLAELLKRVPEKINTYYEPFVGGGALFFALAERKAFRKAYLFDTNDRLVRTYKAVRDNVEGVLEELRQYESLYKQMGSTFYLAQRAEKVDELDDIAVASWLIFMNKTCFNGLYRVNSSGIFNVPHGKFASPPVICDEENLRACSEALQGVVVENVDFEASTEQAKLGDFVYFDPPYIPVSDTSNFTSYTKEGFTTRDQMRLTTLMKKLKLKGVGCLLSNAGTPKAESFYRSCGFHVDVVKARRAINSKASARGAVKELLVY